MTICEATLWHAATATATKTEVGFPPLLYLASNRFLRFPSDYPNLDMDVVSDFTLFIEICFSCWDFKMVHGCACNVRPFSVLENIFPVFCSVFYPASNGYKTRVGMVFPPFC